MEQRPITVFRVAAPPHLLLAGLVNTSPMIFRRSCGSPQTVPRAMMSWQPRESVIPTPVLRARS